MGNPLGNPRSVDLPTVFHILVNGLVACPKCVGSCDHVGSCDWSHDVEAGKGSCDESCDTFPGSHVI